MRSFTNNVEFVSNCLLFFDCHVSVLRWRCPSSLQTLRVRDILEIQKLSVRVRAPIAEIVTFASSLTLFNACFVVICFSTSCSSWRRFSASVASGTSFFSLTVVTNRLSFGLSSLSASGSCSTASSPEFSCRWPNLLNLSCSSIALRFFTGIYSSSLQPHSLVRTEKLERGLRFF